jgi:hypothetical protein
LELVRYIHLNPLRAKLVPSMAELDRYEFCGHEVILGKHQKDWQDVDKHLGIFGKRVAAARRNYRAYVEQGIGLGRRPDLYWGRIDPQLRGVAGRKIHAAASDSCQGR